MRTHRILTLLLSTVLPVFGAPRQTKSSTSSSSSSPTYKEELRRAETWSLTTVTRATGTTQIETVLVETPATPTDHPAPSILDGDLWGPWGFPPLVERLLPLIWSIVTAPADAAAVDEASVALTKTNNWKRDATVTVNSTVTETLTEIVFLTRTSLPTTTVSVHSHATTNASSETSTTATYLGSPQELPPPIPWSSIITNTLTMSIPDHGTTVVDGSSQFGPWPVSSSTTRSEIDTQSSVISVATSSPSFSTTVEPTTITIPAASPSSSTTLIVNATSTFSSHTEILTLTLTLTPTPTPFTTTIITTTTSSAGVECDVSFCSEDGTSYCMYWGGVTANGWGGPRPGETIEPIGSCTVPHVQATPTANAVKEDLIMIGE